jgi:hypothetical protein
LSNKLKYSLSFTGYSLGAWLAEQSLFFCHNHFDGGADETSAARRRAVTFESPGSAEFIADLTQPSATNKQALRKKLNKDLDIRSYLLAPNFLNTSNEHLGKIYQLSTTANTTTTTTNHYLIDEFIMNNLINNLPNEKIRTKMLTTYSERVEPFIGGPLNFFVTGLHSLFAGDELDLIRAEFDESTSDSGGGEIQQQPLIHVLNWPKMTLKSNTGSNKSLDSDHIKAPPFIGIIPDGVRQFAANPFTLIPKTTITTMAKHLLPTLNLFYNMVKEIFDVNVDRIKQLSSHFEYGENVAEVSENEIEVVSKPDFKLLYQTKYKTKRADLFEDDLDAKKQRHLDNLLFKLYYEEDHYKKSHIWVQFRKLKELFSITGKWSTSSGEYDYIIKSGKIEIERVRARLIILYF